MILPLHSDGRGEGKALSRGPRRMRRRRGAPEPGCRIASSPKGSWAQGLDFKPAKDYGFISKGRTKPRGQRMNPVVF